MAPGLVSLLSWSEVCVVARQVLLVWDGRSGVPMNGRSAPSSFTGSSMAVPLFRAFFQSLKRTYEEMCPAEQRALVLTRIWSMVMRYETLAGLKSGSQSALPRRVFDAMAGRFGIEHECFASPLNRHLASYVRAHRHTLAQPRASAFGFFSTWLDALCFMSIVPLTLSVEGGILCLFTSHGRFAASVNLKV